MAYDSPRVVIYGDHFADRDATFPRATPEELAERSDSYTGCWAGLVPWVCTRPKGHDGIHIALDSDSHVCAKWFSGPYVIQEEP